GTSYAYFLLQFTGVRSDPNEILSIDYSTRNGTAEANEDYIAVNGTLNLYPNENKAVIPVEVIGDTRPERDEYFYLDVFNPVGGSFGEGVVKLTAIRTIVDDDGWLG
ncbi:MAG: sodium:calcium exchanger, partial [Alcaligenaceae bacterium]|nr:sodium:calcium exchanger [Alcaligenaceae bacterium]